MFGFLDLVVRFHFLLKHLEDKTKPQAELAVRLRAAASKKSKSVKE